MATKRYNNYSDMITFSRASSGTALAKISYGAELVTNGTFDSDVSGWSPGANSGTISWSAGTGVVANDGTAYNMGVSAPITLEIGATYEISVECVSAATSLPFFTVSSLSSNKNTNTQFGDASVSAGSTETRIFTATISSAYIHLLASGTGTATFDNISVKPVLYDQADGTLQLFNHPTNQPRVEYDAQGNRLGLLVEEARTNLLTYSEDFSQSSWTLFTVTRSLTSETTSPDGASNAYKLTSGATTFPYLGTSITSGTSAFSVYLKYVDNQWIALNFGNIGVTMAWFDVQNGIAGSVASGYSSFIEPAGNGWYRCTVVGSNTNNSANIWPGITGDGATTSTSGKSVYIYGAQFEEGSFPTSYIPTSGATATRSADVASIGVGAFGYNKTAGTVVLTARLKADPSILQIPVFLGDNPSTTHIDSMLFFSTGEYRVRDTSSNTLANLDVGDFSTSTHTKASFVYKTNDFAAAIDGGTVGTDTSGDVSTVTVDTLSLSANPGGTKLAHHISSIAYYPRRLTDAQIKALTSPPETPTLSLSFDGSSTSYLETNIHG